MTADLDIFETIAAAVAEAREPDLSAFEPTQVRAAMEQVLSVPSSRRAFLAWLDNRVQTLSHGTISIVERQVDQQGQDVLGLILPTLAISLVIEGEPFAEPAVIQADSPVLLFVMRG